jgi:hypothetical protein
MLQMLKGQLCRGCFGSNLPFAAASTKVRKRPEAVIAAIASKDRFVPQLGHSHLKNAARCTNGGNAKAAARHRAYRPAAA